MTLQEKMDNNPINWDELGKIAYEAFFEIDPHAADYGEDVAPRPIAWEDGDETFHKAWRNAARASAFWQLPSDMNAWFIESLKESTGSRMMTAIAWDDQSENEKTAWCLAWERVREHIDKG